MTDSKSNPNPNPNPNPTTPAFSRRVLLQGVGAVGAVALGASVLGRGAAVATRAAPAGVATAAPDRYAPTWASVDQHPPAPEWFQDAKFGIYHHWGVFSVPAYGSEWYGRNMYRPGSGENQHHIETYGDPSVWPYNYFITGAKDKAGNFVQFAPKLKSEGGNFDPDAWAQLFVDAGARFAGPVAEHHDGFSMWNSSVNEWNSANMGPKLDLLGIFAEAYRRKGLKLLTAMHHAFNYNGFYEYAPKQTDPSLQKLYGQLPRDQENQLWYDKLKEVVDQAQPDIIWQDFSLDSPGYCQSTTSPCKVDEQQRLNFLSYYYNQANKWNKEVVTTFKQFDSGFNTNGQVADYERGGPADIVTPYWLTDDSISSSSWCYTQGIGYYSAPQMIHSLIDRVSKNGNMLLNVSPTADGTIPQGQRDVLRDMGEYLKRYGESIYSTRAWDVYGEGPTKMGGGSFTAPKVGTNKDIRFTRNKKGKVLYATVLGWPGDGATLDITTLGSDRVNLADLKQVELLGSSPQSYIKLPDYYQDAAALHITLPNRPTASPAYVVKLTFRDEIPAPKPSTGAAVYERADYLGSSATLQPGEYTAADLQKLGVSAEKISALRVAALFQITVYPEDNFQGTPRTYTSDVLVDKQTKVGSLKVDMDLSRPFTLQSVANGFAIDTGGSVTPGSQLELRTLDGGVTQRWQVIETEDGFVRLENPANGLVIDGAGGASGSFVQQSAWTGSPQQQWKLVIVGQGTVLNRETDLALDSGGAVPEGSPLKQWRADGSPNLQWRLSPTG